ncbi:ABC transporter permease [Amycolatopsis jejuensis]|uniref:ABC transporter permease n=1 Tax=Amycolatopsis jejuensis TaxID=330084 RepID=UPI0007C46903|nr:ABC transporter permease [Amycolatopsis jejuensis]
MADVSLAADPRLDGPAKRRRMPVLVVLSVAFTGIVVVLAIAGNWLTPYDVQAQDVVLGSTGPSGAHWLGTDTLGRDILSMVIAGTRTAVLGPLCLACAAVLLGSTLGIVAAYRGGFVDGIANRFADFMYAVPGTLVVIVVAGVVGGGYWIAVALMTVLALPVEIRLCRSAALVQVRLPYIEAARTLGLSGPRILFHHVLPNILPTVVATFLLDFVAGLVGLSGLAYLGLGAPPGSPDWGSLLSDGQALLTVNPWLTLAPGVMIVLTATSVTLLGDWLYDRSERKGAQQ